MIVFIRSDEQKNAYYRGASDYRAGVSMLDCPFKSPKEWNREREKLLPFYWHGGWMDEYRRDHPEGEVVAIGTQGRVYRGRG